MGGILITLFTILLILICLMLILVVLMQRANTNAGLGAAFGGGMAESVLGAETGNVLTRSTIVLTIAFFVLSFGLYLGNLNQIADGEGAGALPDLPAAVEPAGGAPVEPLPDPGADADADAGAGGGAGVAPPAPAAGGDDTGGSAAGTPTPAPAPAPAAGGPTPETGGGGGTEGSGGTSPPPGS